jgi:hypothetical protein
MNGHPSEPSWLRESSPPSASSSAPVVLSSDDDVMPSASYAPQTYGSTNNSDFQPQRMSKKDPTKPAWAVDSDEEDDPEIVPPGRRPSAATKQASRPLLNNNDKQSSRRGGKNDLEEGLLPSPQSSAPPPPVRRTFIHGLCLGLQVLSALSSTSLVAANVLSIMYRYGMPPVHLILRGYGVLFGLFVIMAELEVGPYFRDSRMMSSWVMRGLVYSFLGVIGTEESISVNLDKSSLPNGAAVELFAQIASYCMVACGGCYILLGLLCCKGRKDKAVAAYVTLKKQREMEEALRHQASVH